MTLSLHPHRENRSRKILAGIPRIKKRISVDKWHQVLGELRSMDIALPGIRGILIHMQESLSHVDSKRVALTRGVHQALVDFQWLAEDLG